MNAQPAQGPADWTPAHYRGNGMQPFDVINAFNLDFYEGNAIKYLLRWRKKNGAEDLRKARTYVQVLIDREQPTRDDDEPVDARAIVADLRTENQALRDRISGLAVGLRYLLNYRGPHHDHERPGIWDTSGKPCDHCGRLAAIHADLTVVEQYRPGATPAHVPEPQAPATDEDVVRAARLDSLGVLLSRIRNGVALSTDEGKLLVEHVDAEIRESTTARSVAAGNKRHVQAMYAELQETQRERDQVEAERDGAYRERAHLIALLAALAPNSVLGPAPDVDEPGWTIAYLTIGGHQASWHISPRDADLFAHVEAVDQDDPRARWDGHTTEEKYARIAQYTAEVAELGVTPGRQAQAAVERVRRLHDRLAEKTDLASPDDEITRGAAAKRIAAALDGTEQLTIPDLSAVTRSDAATTGLDGALRIVADWCAEAQKMTGTDEEDLARQLEEAGYQLPTTSDTAPGSEENTDGRK